MLHYIMMVNLCNACTIQIASAWGCSCELPLSWCPRNFHVELPEILYTSHWDILQCHNRFVLNLMYVALMSLLCNECPNMFVVNRIQWSLPWNKKKQRNAHSQVILPVNQQDTVWGKRVLNFKPRGGREMISCLKFKLCPIEPSHPLDGKSGHIFVHLLS